MGGKPSKDEPTPLTAAEHNFQVGDRVQTQWTGAHNCSPLRCASAS